MRDDDPMRHSGAAWCDEHDRWECSKNTKRGGIRCHQLAIRGTSTCRVHAGQRTALVKARGEANMLAWSTAAATGQEEPLDVARVVMDQLRLAVMRADLFGERLRLQVEEEEGAGLVGRTFAAGRDGQRVETGEQVRALAKLEAEWRDRVVRFAKTAHDMGVDSRRLELEQAQASQVVTAVGAGLEALQLDGGQRDVFLSAFLVALGSQQPVTVAGEVGA